MNGAACSPIPMLPLQQTSHTSPILKGSRPISWGNFALLDSSLLTMLGTPCFVGQLLHLGPRQTQLYGSQVAARVEEQIQSWVLSPELSFPRSSTGRGRLGTALQEAALGLKDSKHHQDWAVNCDMAGEPGKESHWGHVVREASWRRQ